MQQPYTLSLQEERQPANDVPMRWGCAAPVPFHSQRSGTDQAHPQVRTSVGPQIKLTSQMLSAHKQPHTHMLYVRVCQLLTKFTTPHILSFYTLCLHTEIQLARHSLILVYLLILNAFISLFLLMCYLHAHPRAAQPDWSSFPGPAATSLAVFPP